MENSTILCGRNERRHRIIESALLGIEIGLIIIVIVEGMSK